MNYLMVCLGNICRSPTAEGVLAHKLKMHKLSGNVDSAGTGSWHAGEHPDLRATATAKMHGIDISAQRARQITRDDFSKFDRIYVADREVYNSVIRMARNEEEKNKVDFLMNVLDPNGDRPVPDPYFGGDEGFESVFHMIDEACEEICRKQKAQS